MSAATSKHLVMTIISHETLCLCCCAPPLACATAPTPKPQPSQVMVAQSEDSLTSECEQNPAYCRLLSRGDEAGPLKGLEDCQ